MVRQKLVARVYHDCSWVRRIDSIGEEKDNQIYLGIFKDKNSH